MGIAFVDLFGGLLSVIRVERRSSGWPEGRPEPATTILQQTDERPPKTKGQLMLLFLGYFHPISDGVVDRGNGSEEKRLVK
jgi:hypothetical protein